ncbi:MAG: sigma-54 dependent transcriptional regulator [Succinivibrionaceae bacterium]|nr:sigma-54 dependent transcriptional regulator [Succinivibrionaceae bacterium]
MQFSGNVLILERDPARRQIIETIFSFLGMQCQNGAVEDCLSYLDAEQGGVDVAILGDLGGKGDGPALLQGHKDCAFILIGDGQEPPAGVADQPNYMGSLGSDPDYEQVVQLLHYCQSFRSMRKLSRKSGSGASQLIKLLVGKGPAITQVRRLIEQVAKTDATVLILGESGTGKEVVAHAIHELSERHAKAFVPVNCGAIPGELLESELFGHEKGAFTGAISSRAGRFELAEGGTLFLDEIGDMPFQMQVKLLRVLQERQYTRVGSNKVIPANVRIVAATHQNLEQMVEDGKFREDLFYRLNVFPIATPPLRERCDDIPLLVQELVSRHGKEQHATVRFTQRAMAQLMQGEWKGNVRELSNLVERLLILHPNEIVDVSDLPPKYRGELQGDDPAAEREALLDVFSSLGTEGDDDQPVFGEDEDAGDAGAGVAIEGEGDMASAFTPSLDASGVNLKDMISNIEISMIRQALQQCHGVVAKASEALGLRRTTLVEKMKKYGISAQD